MNVFSHGGRGLKRRSLKTVRATETCLDARALLLPPSFPCRSAVTRNSSEKCINSILEHVSSSSNMELLQVSHHANCRTAMPTRALIRQPSRSGSLTYEKCALFASRYPARQPDQSRKVG
eukprot:1194863-Prorocentrum_minimum.AAC.2